MPLIMFPFILSLCTDAWVSLGRIGQFLTAEELAPPYPIDTTRKFAVEIDGDFTWEVADIAKATTGNDKGKGKGAPGSKDDKKVKKEEKANKKKEEKAKKKKKGDSAEPTEPSPSATVVTADEGEIFTLKNLKMYVPNGQFVAIVGRIGAGKSSVLNALIGEMRKTRGEASACVDVVWNFLLNIIDRSPSTEQWRIHRKFHGWRTPR